MLYSIKLDKSIYLVRLLICRDLKEINRIKKCINNSIPVGLGQEAKSADA